MGDASGYSCNAPADFPDLGRHPDRCSGTGKAPPIRFGEGLSYLQDEKAETRPAKEDDKEKDAQDSDAHVGVEVLTLHVLLMHAAGWNTRYGPSVRVCRCENDHSPHSIGSSTAEWKVMLLIE